MKTTLPSPVMVAPSMNDDPVLTRDCLYHNFFLAESPLTPMQNRFSPMATTTAYLQLVLATGRHRSHLREQRADTL